MSTPKTEYVACLPCILSSKINLIRKDRFIKKGSIVMKKKVIAIILSLSMASMIAACSAGTAETSQAQETEAAQTEASAGMANPWSDVSSAEEAAAGAGIDSFILAENGTMTDNGPLDFAQFRCMDGIAEATGNIGAGVITIRKGIGDDISGDYNTYEYTWDLDVNGITVHCSSNLDDSRAQLVEWQNEGYSFVAYFISQGESPDEFGVGSGVIEPLVADWVR